MEATLNPLEPLEKESSLAHEAFLQYVLMGADRSIAKARAKFGGRSVSVRTWEKWSTRWGWIERVEAVDVSMMERKAENAQLSMDEAQDVFFSVFNADNYYNCCLTHLAIIAGNQKEGGRSKLIMEMHDRCIGPKPKEVFTTSMAEGDLFDDVEDPKVVPEEAEEDS